MKNLLKKAFMPLVISFFLFSCSNEQIIKSAPAKSSEADVSLIATTPNNSKPVIVWEYNGDENNPDCWDMYCDCVVVGSGLVNSTNQQAVADFENSVGDVDLIKGWFNSESSGQYSNLQGQQLADLKDGTVTVKSFSGYPYYHIVYPSSSAPGGNNRPNYPSLDIY
jgi:hypothetical protein